MSRNKKVWFANLNGLRFMAFLGVFLSHSFYTNDLVIQNQPLYILLKKLLSVAGFGVDFFFVLSGYLITYSLLHEEIITGSINTPDFYARRILRIWPLYYVCLLIGFLLFPQLKSFLKLPAGEVGNPILYFTFLSNFDYIRHGIPAASFLGVFWSVAIEEQFYLIWPLLLIAGKFNRLLLFILLLTVSILFRYFNAVNEVVLYFHTVSALSSLSTGALVAWFCLRFDSFTTFFRNLTKSQIIGIYVAGLIVLLNLKTIFSGDLLVAFERFAMAIFFSFIILEQNYATNSALKIASSRFFTYWDRYTYGLYCLHLIVLLFITSLFRFLRFEESLFTLTLQSALALSVSLTASWLSYHYFEKYFFQ